ncbi:MAG: 2-succinyl-5-enolpyruvyl-6-hydroxy-3-cyclohexene-1-carboxylic-acid synthase [Cyanobacteriota bacterium]|nr:2-succinyl-5-enolpyruvyl-6-hydroxy-3-cyclohexene-1-carboxylic-acid synthase [Cyanobacteriota bacterium]
MPIDLSNTNTVWASVLVETLARLGLSRAILSPGSRSTPLTIAFATHRDIEAIPVLDERSAAFFALGLARQTGVPAILVCTSGTAGANFYPAVIEARESRVPLLVLTADRPPELRECHAGQAIDQLKLYGTYPNWQAELAIPSLKLSMLAYLRQTIVHAWERTRFPTAGVVHLNCPFRDPLPPIPEAAAAELATEFPSDFFEAIAPPPSLQIAPDSPTQIWQTLAAGDRGIIVAGLAQPQNPQRYCQAIAHLAKILGWPVLAEGLSPVRNDRRLNPYLITTYDAILRHPQRALEFAPRRVLQIGELPTSKVLRTWLATHQPQRWILDPAAENFDPLHGKTTHWRGSIESLQIPDGWHGTRNDDYCQRWTEAETQVRGAIDSTLDDLEAIVEPKVAWMLSRVLPPQTPLFIANSMPVRDVEFFWPPGDSQIQPFFNRGANGIDGTLSAALGIAHRHRSSVLLTGDLALLHDTNGFLLGDRFVGHLTIVLINNNGGGIFEMLPISQFDPPFETFFATPQNIDFEKLCATYGVEYELICDWPQLSDRLNPLPDRGIRLLELKTDRKADARWRKAFFQQLETEVFDRD